MKNTFASRITALLSTACRATAVPARVMSRCRELAAALGSPLPRDGRACTSVNTWPRPGERYADSVMASRGQVQVRVLVLVLYALISMGSPALHHDFSCHSKSPAHCTACTASPAASQ